MTHGLEPFMRQTSLLLFVVLIMMLQACQEDASLPTAVPTASDEALAPPVISDDPIVLPTETAVPVTIGFHDLHQNPWLWPKYAF